MSKKSPEVKEEILLGIDYGSRRIGLAFGRAGLVQPLRVISGSNTNAAVSDIARLCIENDVTKVVVGLPLTADEKETAQSMETRKFAKILKIKLKKPIDFVNEYETSLDANKTMLGLGFSKGNRSVHDHYSAALILKNFYEANS